MLEVGYVQRAHGLAGEVRVRFLREAKSAGRLNHANIVAIYDVGDALYTPVLKRVVEHDEVAPGALRVFNAGETIGRYDDADVRIDGTVNEWFVLTVSTEHDGGRRASFHQLPRQVRRHRRLPRSADREVTNGERRNRRRMRRQHA